MSTSTTNCLGDVGATADLVPSSDTKLAISCDDSGVCVNKVDASVDTPAGKKACVVVSGEGHTVKADSAVAVQTRASGKELRKCSPFFEGETLRHNFSPGFTDDAATAAWEGVSGTYSEFSFDTNIGDSTAICENVANSEAGAGVPQFCGGQCDMVFLGRKDVSTNMEKRIYASACKTQNNDYSIYRLAFTDFEVRYTAVINGTVWNLWEEQPADMTLSLDSLELANPFEGYEMALQGDDYSTAYASQSAMSVTNCNGYCGFASSSVSDLLLTMYGRCVTPSDGCGSTSSSSSCTATVQSFDQSRAGDRLPVTVSNAILEYNNTNVIVNVSASAIPLRGRVTFSVPNAERVLPSEAATNVNGISTTLLPQDADHEDVVVVYTDGAVATASRDCAFTLLETRDKNRMYSMRNVRNVTECDLLLLNGASERSLSVAAQTTKNSGAVPVANATALWPVNPPGSESRSSGLSKGAKIGIGVGVPVGVIVIACTIVLFVYRCRKRNRRMAQRRKEEEVTEENGEEGSSGDATSRNPLDASSVSTRAEPASKKVTDGNTNDAAAVEMSTPKALSNQAKNKTLQQPVEENVQQPKPAEHHPQQPVQQPKLVERTKPVQQTAQQPKLVERTKPVPEAKPVQQPAQQPKLVERTKPVPEAKHVRQPKPAQQPFEEAAGEAAERDTSEVVVVDVSASTAQQAGDEEAKERTTASAARRAAWRVVMDVAMEIAAEDADAADLRRAWAMGARGNLDPLAESEDRAPLPIVTASGRTFSSIEGCYTETFSVDYPPPEWPDKALARPES